jgi:hypothetical protein
MEWKRICKLCGKIGTAGSEYSTPAALCSAVPHISFSMWSSPRQSVGDHSNKCKHFAIPPQLHSRVLTLYEERPSRAVTDPEISCHSLYLIASIYLLFIYTWWLKETTSEPLQEHTNINHTVFLWRSVVVPHLRNESEIQKNNHGSCKSFRVFCNLFIYDLSNDTVSSYSPTWQHWRTSITL